MGTDQCGSFLRGFDSWTFVQHFDAHFWLPDDYRGGDGHFGNRKLADFVFREHNSCDFDFSGNDIN